MNLFFCCMKRDKPFSSENKPTKESLYNNVVSEKFISRRNKKKQGEDSESKAPTNFEENSNLSDLVEKETFKSSLDAIKIGEKTEEITMKEINNNFSTDLDTEAEDRYQYLLYERGLKEEWVLETNKEDLMVWTKLDSKYQKKCPFIRTWFKIKIEPTENITSEGILEALYNPELRKSWDKSVIFFENFNYNESKTSCSYYMTTKVPVISNRDFLEKRVVFKDLRSQEHISVYWQIEDEKYPKQQNLTRAYTRIGGTLIKKGEGEIEIWTISQVDTELKTFVNALRKMLPGNVEKWVISFKAFLKSDKK